MRIHSKSRTRKILAATWIIPMLVAIPYVFCKSYSFVITSDYGEISRLTCTDRFDDIDTAMYGHPPQNATGPPPQGRFRKGYFMSLFVIMYLVPLFIIVATCIRIAVCLFQPIGDTTPDTSQLTHRMTRRREENKRRVWPFWKFKSSEIKLFSLLI